MILFRTNQFLLLTISLSVVSFSVAQEQDIRAEKPPVIIPTPPNHWLWLLLLFIPALAVAGWFVWRWWQKRNTPEQKYAAIALERLEKIRPLIDEQSPEPLITEASNILRDYIEKRFNIKALSQSTEEFLTNLNENPKYANIQSYQAQVDEFLIACDKVKFGREEMDREDREAILSIARIFFQNSMPEIEN